MNIKKCMSAVLLVCMMAGLAGAYPQPTGYINDFAGIMNAAAEQQMEALCKEVQVKTGTEIAVATFKDLGGEDYSEFANKLFSAWGIGSKKSDAGVLILFALKEKKIRIETGYGVEGILPDALCARIKDEYMLPYFRKGDFTRGLYSGVAVTAQVLAKAKGVTLTGAPRVQQRRQRAQPGKGTFGQKVLQVLLVVFMIYMFIKHPRLMIVMLLMSGRGGRGGGSWGGGGGGFGGGFGGFGGGSSGGGGAGGGW